MTYSRTPTPIAELSRDLDHLGQTASVVLNALIDLLDGRLVPDASLPMLHAATRASQSLVTHLDASRRLVKVA